MSDDRDRDASTDRLLRQALQPVRPASATPACPDAEIIAAWMDGGLQGAALEMTDAHVADCAHCQAVMAAMARAIPEPTSVPVPRARTFGIGWMVPLAAAAVLVLWIAVRREEPAPALVETTASSLPAANVPATPPAAEPAAKPTPTPLQSVAPQPRFEAKPQAKKDAANVAELGATRDALADTKANTQRKAEAAAAAPVAAPQASLAFGRMAPAVVDVLSPDPAVRWRITGAIAQRTTDAGATWLDVPTGIDAQWTAGSSPAPSVCWLVGRGGVVAISTDGRTWRRLDFPVTTDLSAARATDARTATVATVDGRQFVTTDGGATWVEKNDIGCLFLAQEIPAAPFYG